MTVPPSPTTSDGPHEALSHPARRRSTYQGGKIILVIGIPIACLLAVIVLAILGMRTPLPDEAEEVPAGRPHSIRIDYTNWELEIPEDLTWNRPQPRS